MSTFDLQAFVEAPSRRLLEDCRKSDLQQVAAHFSLLVPKQLTKDALRQFVLDFLVSQSILPPPSASVSRPPSPQVTHEEEEKQKDACASENFSPHQSPTSSPLTGARLKLRLARLQIEADERALERKLRHEMEIKRLDADVRLRELELTLQSRKLDPAAVRAVQSAEDSDTAFLPPLEDVRLQPDTPTFSTPPFDISKCLTLLPPFRETEADGFFLAFERMAAILRWPSDVWPLLVTCRLTVSAEVAPPLPDTTQDDAVTWSLLPPVTPRLCNSEALSNLSSSLGHLASSQQEELSHLIHSFPELFSDVPSQTHLITHDISLTDSVPVRMHPYRASPLKRELMKKEVTYLLEHGLAKPSTSSWSSPCLLENKPDGSYRFVTDYRKLNAKTVPDSFPLPRVEDCVDSVGSASFVTKLDLLKGYWQVPLTPFASDVSAFVTPDNLLQYTVLPFGLRNAPATFQRLINQVLSNVPHCSAYLDDIVIYTQSWDLHLQTLAHVFDRLKMAKLTLNLAKCEFVKATVRYLGKEVGQGQVKALSDKIQAIVSFPPPTTRRELRRFLGMTGYYRCFCRNFSTVAKPLTDMLSTNIPFSWTSECNQAFLALRDLLCCAPVLTAPDLTRPFKLEVDASDAGAGAVLLQEDAGGLDHPICYFSRKFNTAQQHYSTIEKETLALIWSLQHFSVYVGNSKFTTIVFTDHNPLIFLHRMYNHNQRLMRWALLLQEFNLDIRHKKGAANVLADALSRSFTLETPLQQTLRHWPQYAEHAPGHVRGGEEVCFDGMPQ
uniref:ribonuclease H n=1 Tax=Nothobranchius korthausae TaxID=1143690 RepID=A0A1A8G0P7_9TELE